jgi:DNA-binding CsgD family transcriptional regulator
VTTEGKSGGARSIERLSARELDVFRLIAAGRETREIAKALGITVHTVDTHKERIKSKLGLRTATELTRAAALWSIGARRE